MKNKLILIGFILSSILFFNSCSSKTQEAIDGTMDEGPVQATEGFYDTDSQ